ncbi:39S ribosomal protein S30, mitochondrial isoform X2 [Onychomys torridus]|uniref:39S ribosomal protein S30, mitochondrial isoform X2 n=1 Tax=Onychomys torridus TaxID=38674 RepID=UPI00167F9DB4|nr:39S ribosomal protein S30, mitochondrial isoform X2 [Onychomys torridus]
MAAARYWKLVPRRGLSLQAAAEASAPATKGSDAEIVVTPVARYPPIVASMTADSKAARLRRVQRWQAAVHAAPSVDEKIRILTKMQFKKYVVYPQTFALNADRWYQGFTKTVYLSGLPPAPVRSPPSLDLAALRAAVCDCILQAHIYLRPARRRRLFDHRQALASSVLDQVVGTLVNLLAPLNPVLTTAALDCKCPVDFYWHRGEERIPAGHRKGHIDALRYQINDKPHNQIRISKQLPEFVPLDYSIPVEIPVMKCKPDKLPLFKRQYENTIFIGFWSEADVTRPFVSQGVITDGKYFSFFCYQLNTLALTVQADQNNPRKNICWGTQSKPLYETVEDKDVKGFDDDVLLQIVDFLLNKPQEDRTQLLGSQEQALDLGP